MNNSQFKTLRAAIIAETMTHMGAETLDYRAATVETMIDEITFTGDSLVYENKSATGIAWRLTFPEPCVMVMNTSLDRFGDGPDSQTVELDHILDVDEIMGHFMDFIGRNI
ncbi:hypothetical protein TIN2_97 [Tsukamurella phage TIN2]|uniref:Uncharacterized protein n=1 Tax=Tsukamurella phage TIN2 TaxID=1636545 RepID=A0A0K0N5U8_9CAUD|nr:hypothetical protein AVT55_gp026 [Tsukamurella phage TIN2]AKJ71787.1 hypothetical protein TIN2_97 [Tsukamurella phage TIN2]